MSNDFIIFGQTIGYYIDIYSVIQNGIIMSENNSTTASTYTLLVGSTTIVINQDEVYFTYADAEANLPGEPGPEPTPVNPYMDYEQFIIFGQTIGYFVDIDFQINQGIITSKDETGEILKYILSVKTAPDIYENFTVDADKVYFTYDDAEDKLLRSLSNYNNKNIASYSDILNISTRWGSIARSFISLSAALDYCVYNLPVSLRKNGQLITFLLNDSEWKIYQYQSNNLENIDYINISNWLSLSQILVDGLAIERQERIDADIILQDNIDNEITTRLANDNTIIQGLNAEVLRATASEQELQLEKLDKDIAGPSNKIVQDIISYYDSDVNKLILRKVLLSLISGQYENVDTALNVSSNDALQAEITARTNADILLQADIDAEISLRSYQIGQEVTARTNADSAIQTSLDNEINRAIAAENSKISKSFIPVVGTKRVLLQSIDIAEANRTDTSVGISTVTIDIESQQSPILATINIPVVSTTKAGISPASDHNQIYQNTLDITSLKSGGIWRATFNTYAAMLVAYPLLDVSGTNWFINDYVYVQHDETQTPRPDGSYPSDSYIVDSTKHLVFRRLEEYIVPQASQSNLGIVKGENTNGKVYVETDGTMSLVGYSAITSELSDHDSAINVLESGLAQEILDRQTADSTFQSQIDTNTGDIAQEILDRASADSAIQTQVTTNTNGLAQEILDRAAADTTLTNNLANEIATRIANEANLQYDINLETYNREQADINLQTQVTTNTNGLAQEIINRGNRDNELKTEIDTIDYNLETHENNTNNPHNVTKTQVGLGNVDNTSDANKPISTATQTALNLKSNLSGATFTGNITAPNIIAGNTIYGGTISDNLNNITKSGFYTCYGTAVGVPNTSYSWFILHQNSNVGIVSATQRAVAYDDTILRVYERVKMSSTWGSWKEVAAENISFTPAGTITATNVQTAIEQAAQGGGGLSSVAIYNSINTLVGNVSELKLAAGLTVTLETTDRALIDTSNINCGTISGL